MHVDMAVRREEALLCEGQLAGQHLIADYAHRPLVGAEAEWLLAKYLGRRVKCREAGSSERKRLACRQLYRRAKVRCAVTS